MFLGASGATRGSLFAGRAGPHRAPPCCKKCPLHAAVALVPIRYFTIETAPASKLPDAEAGQLVVEHLNFAVATLAGRRCGSTSARECAKPCELGAFADSDPLMHEE